VPSDLLWNAVQASGSDSVWTLYAGLGRDEATRVLQERPEPLSRLAPIALGVVPGVIERLLDQAVGDRRNLGSHCEHPLRLIQDWVAAARPGSGQALARRTTLLRFLLQFTAIQQLKTSADFGPAIPSLQPIFLDELRSPVTTHCDERSTDQRRTGPSDRRRGSRLLRALRPGRPPGPRGRR
jgi:hypothetical protein